MELANKLLDLIKNERYTEWPRKKLIEKADEFKRNYENKILVKENMELDGRARTIYPTVSEALKNSRDDDTIVTACGLYKVFTTYQDYLRYLTSIYDIDKLGKIDAIPHFQIIPSDEIQNFVIVCKDADVNDIQDVVDELILKFKKLQPEHIKCVPVNDESIYIVLKSLYDTYTEARFQIRKFIESVQLGELKTRLGTLELKFDDTSKNHYVEMPIRVVISVPYDMCKDVGPEMHTNITHDLITEDTEIDTPEKWIEANPPKNRTLRVHYNNFIEETKSKMVFHKFNTIMEKEGYERKKVVKGIIWTRKH